MIKLLKINFVCEYFIARFRKLKYLNVPLVYLYIILAGFYLDVSLLNFFTFVWLFSVLISPPFTLQLERDSISWPTIRLSIITST